MAPHYGAAIPLDDTLTAVEVPARDVPDASTRRRTWLRAVTALGCAAAAAALVGPYVYPISGEEMARVATGGHPNAAEAVGRVMAYNTYHLDSGRAFSGKGYPFAERGAVVEPHRETTLYVTHEAGASVAQQRWVVTAPDGTTLLDSTDDSSLEPSSSSDSVQLSATFTALKPGAHAVSVFVDGAETYTKTLWSTYVRRSVYDMNEDDRDAFLDAVALLGSLTDDEAQAQYGEDCRSLSFFLSVHLNMAAGRVSDKFHDGMGFLTQHASLTNEFELALQAISPAITVPYWDYTYEGELARSAGTLEAAWDTELWTDAWFGDARTEEHTVTTGRFAYQRVDTATDDATIKNAYGYLRAPWNVNKSPFLTRSHKFCNVSMGYDIWPSCESHWNMTFSSSYDTFYDWIWTAGYAPHGPIHYYIGGYTNCGDMESDLEDIAPNAGAVDSWARLMVALPKTAYRAFLTNSPTCSSDVPQAQCHMECVQNEKKPGEVDHMVTLFAEVAAGLAGTGIPVDYKWLQTLDDTQASNLARVFCTTPYTPGEQIEAASPADASFWPIHPTVERLFQYKRLANDFTTMKWENIEDESQTWYCQQGVTVEAAAMRGMTDLCQGHHAVDMTLFATSLRQDDGTFARAYLTNLELAQATSPASYQMAYIYDDFSWDHCSDAGVDFPEVEWTEAADVFSVESR